MKKPAATIADLAPVTTIRANVERIGDKVCAVFGFDADRKRDAKTIAETLGAWIGQAGADSSGSHIDRRIVGAPTKSLPLGMGAECVIKAVRDEAERAGFTFVWR